MIETNLKTIDAAVFGSTQYLHYKNLFQTESVLLSTTDTIKKNKIITIESNKNCMIKQQNIFLTSVDKYSSLTCASVYNKKKIFNAHLKNITNTNMLMPIKKKCYLKNKLHASKLLLKFEKHGNISSVSLPKLKKKLYSNKMNNKIQVAIKHMPEKKKTLCNKTKCEHISFCVSDMIKTKNTTQASFPKQPLFFLCKKKRIILNKKLHIRRINKKINKIKKKRNAKSLNVLKLRGTTKRNNIISSSRNSSIVGFTYLFFQLLLSGNFNYKLLYKSDKWVKNNDVYLLNLQSPLKIFTKNQKLQFYSHLVYKKRQQNNNYNKYIKSKTYQQQNKVFLSLK